MFKTIKAMGSSFGNTFKSNIDKDIEHAKGQGAADKADFLYTTIKRVIKSSWNSMIDKIINLLLHSAMKDLRALVKECRTHGIDPRDYMPENVLDRLPKNFA